MPAELIALKDIEPTKEAQGVHPQGLEHIRKGEYSPIYVYREDGCDLYRIYDGKTRVAMARLLGLDTIRAQVVTVKRRKGR